MTCTGEALHWYWQSPYLTKFSFTIFIKFASPKPSQVKDNMYVLISINTTESKILFQARTLRVQIYSNQKEIEYVNLTFQLILEPVLKPVLPSPTFYRPPPPPSVARFCDTRISSLKIDFGWLIFESFALPSLENTIGTISPFLFAINHRKCCSKRHLKNIILLNIDLCACVCACVRVCVLMNNKTTKE